MGRKVKALTPQQIRSFFEALSRENPSPQGELHYVNAYTLLVAVVLSAQATDIGVNKATTSLFQKVQTPDQMAALGEEALKAYIKTIGLYNTKAQNIIKLSTLLINNFNGIVPADRDALETLPGVGRKTANVVMNIAFNVPTIAVDTHVFRVSNRTGLAQGEAPLKIEEALLKRIPKNYLYHAHHWLILLGRYTCKAGKPLCNKCVVRDICNFPEKNI